MGPASRRGWADTALYVRGWQVALNLSKTAPRTRSLRWRFPDGAQRGHVDSLLAESVVERLSENALPGDTLSVQIGLEDLWNHDCAVRLKVVFNNGYPRCAQSPDRCR